MTRRTDAAAITDSPVRLDVQNSIAIVVIDDPHERVNIVNESYKAAMKAIISQIEVQANQLDGVILTSAKDTFFAGGDLGRLSVARPPTYSAAYAHVEDVKALNRRLELLEIPVIAAINGSALGGGFELCLACHYRISIESPSVEIGLPEISIGLIPGGGGVVRTARMLGVKESLEQVILPARRFRPDAALRLGLIDQLVQSPDELLPASVSKIRQFADGKGWRKPWDSPDYRPSDSWSLKELSEKFSNNPPSGMADHGGFSNPAIQLAIRVATTGHHLSFEQASAIESDALATVASSSTSIAMIGCRFTDRARSRAEIFGGPPLQTLGVLGKHHDDHPIVEQSKRIGVSIERSTSTSDLRTCDAIINLRDTTTLMTTAPLIRAKSYDVTLPSTLGKPFQLVTYIHNDKLHTTEIMSAEHETIALWHRHINKIGVNAIVSNGVTSPVLRLANVMIDEVTHLLDDGFHFLDISKACSAAGFTQIDRLINTAHHTNRTAAEVSPKRHRPDSREEKEREISFRLTSRIALEFLEIVNRNDTLTPHALNIATVEILGFPVTTGGPLRFLTRAGPESTYLMPEEFRRLAKNCGDRFSSETISESTFDKLHQLAFGET